MFSTWSLLSPSSSSCSYKSLQGRSVLILVPTAKKGGFSLAGNWSSSSCPNAQNLSWPFLHKGHRISSPLKLSLLPLFDIFFSLSKLSTASFIHISLLSTVVQPYFKKENCRSNSIFLKNAIFCWVLSSAEWGGVELKGLSLHLRWHCGTCPHFTPLHSNTFQVTVIYFNLL